MIYIRMRSWKSMRHGEQHGGVFRPIAEKGFDWAEFAQSEKVCSWNGARSQTFDEAVVPTVCALLHHFPHVWDMVSTPIGLFVPFRGPGRRLGLEDVTKRGQICWLSHDLSVVNVPHACGTRVSSWKSIAQQACPAEVSHRHCSVSHKSVIEEHHPRIFFVSGLWRVSSTHVVVRGARGFWMSRLVLGKYWMSSWNWDLCDFGQTLHSKAWNNDYSKAARLCVGVWSLCSSTNHTN